MAKEGILLESGTNEVEILEFYLGRQSFGVNVLKIQAIELYDPQKVTAMPMAPSSMSGMLLFRDNTIPLIDLRQHLGVVARLAEEELDLPPVDDAQQETADQGQQQERRIVLVTEFTNRVTAFIVDGVNRIHRLSWQDLGPMNPVFEPFKVEFTGSVNVEGREVLIVDMEKILADVLPREFHVVDEEDEGPEESRAEDRSEVKIILAEDSSAIRAMLTKVLQQGNYRQIEFFDNGASAYEALRDIRARADQEGKPVSDYVNLVISDIEMPKMDGLALCKNIKTGLGMGSTPVMMFSSLINDQTEKKCKEVGADACISKPQFGQLIDMIDGFCLKRSEEAA